MLYVTEILPQRCPQYTDDVFQPNIQCHNVNNSTIVGRCLRDFLECSTCNTGLNVIGIELGYDLIQCFLSLVSYYPYLFLLVLFLYYLFSCASNICLGFINPCHILPTVTWENIQLLTGVKSCLHPMVATTTVPPYQVCHQVDSISISERERESENIQCTKYLSFYSYTLYIKSLGPPSG